MRRINRPSNHIRSRSCRCDFVAVGVDFAHLVEIPFLRLFLVVRLVTPLHLYVVFFGRRVKTWYLVVRNS